MLKSYEAIYENGQLTWLDEQPQVDSARIIVTVLEEKFIGKPVIQRMTCIHGWQGEGCRRYCQSYCIAFAILIRTFCCLQPISDTASVS